jgi:hypothetical protein
MHGTGSTTTGSAAKTHSSCSSGQLCSARQHPWQHLLLLVLLVVVVVASSCFVQHNQVQSSPNMQQGQEQKLLAAVQQIDGKGTNWQQLGRAIATVQLLLQQQQQQQQLLYEVELRAVSTVAVRLALAVQVAAEAAACLVAAAGVAVTAASAAAKVTISRAVAVKRVTEKMK